MFSVYCDQPYQVDPVEVISPGGIRQTYPILSCRTGSVSASKVNRTIGVKLPSVTIAQLLNRMGISAEVGSEDRMLLLHMVTITLRRNYHQLLLQAINYI
ncbi:Phenylalanine--tRNA ligase beta subunit [Trichinella spiralis]|uniref:Phenylalanine--tRNA ligase beta subunit n=1 Tax=Trichinella spiralis TaxID=6334 RepID=A0ABR3KP52_TRISP